MSRRTDYLHPLTSDELERLMEEAERLHNLPIGYLLVTLAAVVAAFVLFGEASHATAAALTALPFGGCGCAAGKDCCDCCGMEQRCGGQAINTDQLLATGAMTGPHRRTRPITLSLRQRLLRALRSLFTTRSPL